MGKHFRLRRICLLLGNNPHLKYLEEEGWLFKEKKDGCVVFQLAMLEIDE